MTYLPKLFEYDGYFNIAAGRNYLIINEQNFSKFKVFMFCGIGFSRDRKDRCIANQKGLYNLKIKDDIIVPGVYSLVNGQKLISCNSMIG